MGKGNDCLNKTDDVQRCRLTNGLRCVVHSLVMVEVNFSISPLKKSDVNDWLPAWRATTSSPSKATSVGVATTPLSLAKSVHSPQHLESVMVIKPSQPSTLESWPFRIGRGCSLLERRDGFVGCSWFLSDGCWWGSITSGNGRSRLRFSRRGFRLCLGGCCRRWRSGSGRWHWQAWGSAHPSRTSSTPP